MAEKVLYVHEKKIKQCTCFSDSCNIVVTPVVESGKEELLGGCRVAVYRAGNSECVG